jgi:hypothetical protein
MPRNYFDAAVSRSERIVAQLLPRECDEVTGQAEALPLRRDMVTLLGYVRDNKVVGTQSTGNLPLKVVHEVSARLVHPPKLEEKVGDHVYRVRSEEDVWQLFYLHVLADVGGLVDAGRARRWRLKRQGDTFLAADPLSQVLFLLLTWWRRVNWLIAYPFAGMGDSLPPSLSSTTLMHLRRLPAKKRVDGDAFADRLIGAARLKWTAPDPDIQRMALHGAVWRMILYPLRDFGVVTLEHRNKPLGRGSIRELAAFRVTPFGRLLLKALEM